MDFLVTNIKLTFQEDLECLLYYIYDELDADLFYSLSGYLNINLLPINIFDNILKEISPKIYFDEIF